PPGPRPTIPDGRFSPRRSRTCRTCTPITWLATWMRRSATAWSRSWGRPTPNVRGPVRSGRPDSLETAREQPSANQLTARVALAVGRTHAGSARPVTALRCVRLRSRGRVQRPIDDGPHAEGDEGDGHAGQGQPDPSSGRATGVHAPSPDAEEGQAKGRNPH